MANVWFGSDWHLDHKSIAKFRKQVVSSEHNTKRILTDVANLVTKRDTLYLLGDIAFSDAALQLVADIPCRKFLVRGNHDELTLSQYAQVFDDVFGIVRYKDSWLTHCPVHEDELRGKFNIHGHVHYATVTKQIDGHAVRDPRYFNCCPENLWELTGKSIISLDELRAVLYNRPTPVTVQHTITINKEKAEQMFKTFAQLRELQNKNNQPQE
jgi:calcineurin-like phosphoesterase family protein